MTILEEIFERKKTSFSEKDILKRKLNKQSNTRFSDALKGKDRVSMISEIKLASPSKGNLKLNYSPVEIVKMYEKNGASAISVVTEENYFGGSKELFSLVRNSTSLPILRKDFFWNRLQIEESKNLGADAVLLIASILDEENILELLDYAKEIGIEVLLETHAKDEFISALNSKADCVGINNRNLKTMKVDINHSLDLLKDLVNQNNKILISESGISKKEDLKLLNGSFDAVLIGTTLLESDNPGEKLRELKSIF